MAVRARSLKGGMTMGSVKAIVLAVMVAGCQKHEDTTTSTTAIATASTSTSATASASVTPLTTIEPLATASAAPSATTPTDASRAVPDPRAAALSKEAEEMQMQMLKALGNSGGSATQGVLQKSDIPPVDLSAIAEKNAGTHTGDLHLGGGGGTVLPGRAGGGLSAIGARDH